MKKSATEKALRRAVRLHLKAGGSLYGIAKAVGCQPGQVGRFARGERDIFFALAGRIADHLGLVLRSKG